MYSCSIKKTHPPFSWTVLDIPLFQYISRVLDVHSLTIRCIYPQLEVHISTYIYIWYIYIYFFVFCVYIVYTFFSKQDSVFCFSCFFDLCAIWIPTMPPRLLPLDRDQGPRFHWKGHRYTVHEFTESRWMSLGVKFFGEVLSPSKREELGWSLDPQIGFSYFRFKIFKYWSSLVEIWLGMARVGYDGVNDITYFGRNYQRVVKCMVVFECALQGA